MLLIRRCVKRKDRETHLPTPASFSVKEEENCAGSGTSANDFKQGEAAAGSH
jgi:hypothetical protein